jgi:uncharacterized protein (UPF0276 family)
MKFGIGWREEVGNDIKEHICEIDVIEIMVDQYMFDLSKKSSFLMQDIPTKPIVFHCVNLSIGSSRIDLEYLYELKRMVNIFNPIFISDHLGITRYKSYDTGIACPLFYNYKNLKSVEANIRTFQKIVGKPLLLENISSPFTWNKADLSEPKFIAELYYSTGVNVLLDLTNLYINCKNNSYDYHEWLEEIPSSSVRELHLAGGNEIDGKLWDSHCCSVAQANWKIYEAALQMFDKVEFVIVERDSNYQYFHESINDLAIAKKIFQEQKQSQNE